MRIISGWAKGRKLVAPPGQTQNIRPTSDRARESLFNILRGKVDTFDGLRVLDLFAGTGALGLEALSRGATEVILVEQNKQALDIIHRNIAACRPEQHDCKVAAIRYDLRKGIPPQVTEFGKSQPFDLIFLDPPYSKGLSLKVLEYLGNGEILSGSCLVVAEERSSESLPECCGVLNLTDQRIYGETGFWLYSPRHLTETEVRS